MNDIRPGEWAYVFLPSLPDAPDASAYHDIKQGVPYALCAVLAHGGNYQIVSKWSGSKQVFAVEGARRKGMIPH